MTASTPVLIVGAGPVGLALAGDLGWRGLSCILVEKSNGAIYQPKMDLVGVRTMEFCRRWGIVPWVEACPYPRDLSRIMSGCRRSQAGSSAVSPSRLSPTKDRRNRA